MVSLYYKKNISLSHIHKMHGKIINFLSKSRYDKYFNDYHQVEEVGARVWSGDKAMHGGNKCIPSSQSTMIILLGVWLVEGDKYLVDMALVCYLCGTKLHVSKLVG